MPLKYSPGCVAILLVESVFMLCPRSRQRTVQRNLRHEYVSSLCLTNCSRQRSREDSTGEVITTVSTAKRLSGAGILLACICLTLISLRTLTSCWPLLKLYDAVELLPGILQKHTLATGDTAPSPTPSAGVWFTYARLLCRLSLRILTSPWMISYPDSVFLSLSP